MRALQDRYGFLFWLRWILWFAGSFVIAALFWTAFMKGCFGAIEGVELTVTWIVSVFGSWLILVIPFMRKKEQIWKRLNDDQEKVVDIWLLGMGIFVGFLVTSLFFWSFIFKDRLAAHAAALDRGWAKAVFASWLLLLIPLLIWMYRMADILFRSAAARQTYEPGYKSIFVETSKRLLPENLSEKLKKEPFTLPKAHVVTLMLKNGAQIPHVFVMNAREILGIYDRETMDFSAGDITDLKVACKDELLPYEETRWLRLDGFAPSAQN